MELVRRLIAVMLVGALAAGPIARAAADEEAPGPLPPPQPEPPPAPEGVRDSADVVSAYDAAFEALVKGDYDTAMRGFDDVAARSVEPDRRAGARELSRYARRMKDAQKLGVVDQHGRMKLDNGGRPYFVVETTLASFYSSFVLLDIFNVDSFRPSVALVTGVTAAGFVGSLFGSEHFRVSNGTSEAYFVGLWTGLGNGLLLGPKLGISPDTTSGSGDGEVNQNYLTFGLATMALGGAAGAYIGHEYEPTTAQARFTGNLAASGGLTVLLGYGVIHPTDVSGETLTALVGVGIDVGLGVGISVAPKLDWSTARTTYVTLGEYLGGLGGFAAAALIGGDSNDTSRLVSGSTLIGLWGGFALSAYLTRNMEPDRRYGGKDESASTRWQLAPVQLGRGATGLGVAGVF
jgi:hypothetical protein